MCRITAEFIFNRNCNQKIRKTDERRYYRTGGGLTLLVSPVLEDIKINSWEGTRDLVIEVCPIINLATASNEGSLPRSAYVLKLSLIMHCSEPV